MKKLFPVLLAAGLFAAFLSCASPLTESAAPVAAVSADRAVTPSFPAEVTLVSYQVYSTSIPYLWYDGKSRKVTLIVKNLGTDKAVSLWAKDGLGAWVTIPATFDRSVNGGTEEIWVAAFGNQATYYTNTGSLMVYDPCVQYAIKYTVGGVTYWDNNNGKDYTTEPVGSRFWALGIYTPGAYYGPGGISAYVKNLTLNKKVTLVYTTDNWATTKTLAGTFVRQVNADYDQWGFTGLSVPAGTTLKYAIAYDPQGYSTIWDNNFGVNYTLNF